MANVVNETNHLENELQDVKSTLTKLWIAFAIFLFIFFPASFILVFFINKNYAEYQKLKSGLNGEKSALKVLSKLGSEYYIISDLEIEHDGKKSQIDSVIVGNNGVFIIETKNVKGYVVGNEENRDITIHKIGRKGGEYSNTMYNPCKQVATHTYRLSKLLEKNNFRPWVQGVVYFSNPETKIEFQSTKTPVFDYKDSIYNQISDYISNFQGRNISKDDKLKIVNLLSKYTML